MNVRRSTNRNALGSPTMIGALTLLTAIVAVTLAFQANNGLPFVPRYTLFVRLRDAEELTRGAEVHMGGALVGSIASIDAARDTRDASIALLDLQLNKSVEPLPVDSTFTVRLKGAIGQKYLDVVRGHAQRSWRPGATVPLARTGAAVDLDQVLSMFTPPTRTGVTASTTGFSDALAGRGADVNAALAALRPLVTDLGPVMRNLAAPRSDLKGFVAGLGRFAGALAPVARQQADLFTHLDTTFRALAGVARPSLQNWIAQTPPTFATTIADGPRIGPFLTDTAALFKTLRPGLATLPASAPVLADAFAAGARNLPGTAALDRRVVSLAHRLETYGATLAVQQGLDRLTLTARHLIAPLAFLAPVQTSCNYVTLFLRNFASTLADDVGAGTVLRFVPIAIDDVPGSEAVPSQAPYLTSGTAGGTNHAPLHADPYPNTASPGQAAECAAGNERFHADAPAIGNPSGNVGRHTETTKRSKGL